MFAIVPDIDQDKLNKGFPAINPHAEISRVLEGLGFRYVHSGLYLIDSHDMAILFQAISVLRDLPWLSRCVRSIHACRVEEWSDFTGVLQADASTSSSAFPPTFRSMACVTRA